MIPVTDNHFMDVPGTRAPVYHDQWCAIQRTWYQVPGTWYRTYSKHKHVLLCTVHYIHAAVPVHVHVFAILIRSIRNTGMLDLSDKYTYKT